MTRSRRTALTYLVILALAFSAATLSGPAWSEEVASGPSAAAPGDVQVAAGAEREPGAVGMVIDGLVVRPLGLVATVLGTVAFVITLPFSALGGNVEEAGENLVVGPAAYTFTRCLGCFGGPD
ncbi:MAG: hypothetical protein OEU25_01500 [Rhodospirillales bacterium]|nr:hypothetical protein [Rhodospirillales bacterium]